MAEEQRRGSEILLKDRDPDILGVTLGALKPRALRSFRAAKCGTVQDVTRCIVKPISYGGSKAAVLAITIGRKGVTAIEVSNLDSDKFLYMLHHMQTKFGPLLVAELTDMKVAGWGRYGWRLVALRQPNGLSHPAVTLQRVEPPKQDSAPPNAAASPDL